MVSHKPPAPNGPRARDQIQIPHVEFSMAESLSLSSAQIGL